MFVPNPWSVKCLDVSTAFIIFSKNLVETIGLSHAKKRQKKSVYCSWLVQGITSSALKVIVSGWATVSTSSSREERGCSCLKSCFSPSWGGSGTRLWFPGLLEVFCSVLFSLGPPVERPSWQQMKSAVMWSLWMYVGSLPSLSKVLVQKCAKGRFSN